MGIDRASGWELFRVGAVWVESFPGWDFSGVRVVRVGVFQGGCCPDENSSGGNYLDGSSSGWELSVVIVF